MPVDYKQVLLWRANDQSTRDNSVFRNGFTLGAGATLDATGGKFGGGAYHSTGAVTAFASTAHDVRQRFTSAGDFYVSAWVKLEGTGTESQQIVVGKASSGSQQFYFGFNSAHTSLGFHHSTNGGGDGIASVTAAVSITEGQWYHVAASRSGGTVRVFLDGTQIASGTLTGTFTNSTARLTVGGIDVNGFNYALKGLINDAQLIVGEAVHTTNFTPETDYIVSPVLTANPLTPRYERAGATRPWPGTRGIVNRQTRTVRTEYTGAYRIYGTVKLDDEPTDIPWKRRVTLFREPDMRPVAMTWSDPITGEFAFDNITSAYKYTVLAVDYEHNYRAVVADNLTASPMP